MTVPKQGSEQLFQMSEHDALFYKLFGYAVASTNTINRVIDLCDDAVSVGADRDFPTGRGRRGRDTLREIRDRLNLAIVTSTLNEDAKVNWTSIYSRLNGYLDLRNTICHTSTNWIFKPVPLYRDAKIGTAAGSFETVIWRDKSTIGTNELEDYCIMLEALSLDLAKFAQTCLGVPLDARYNES